MPSSTIYIAIARILVNYNANMYAVDRNGQKPIDISHINQALKHHVEEKKARESLKAILSENKLVAKNINVAKLVLINHYKFRYQETDDNLGQIRVQKSRFTTPRNKQYNEAGTFSNRHIIDRTRNSSHLDFTLERPKRRRRL